LGSLRVDEGVGGHENEEEGVQKNAKAEQESSSGAGQTGQNSIIFSPQKNAQAFAETNMGGFGVRRGGLMTLARASG